jgi:PAS domain S-box-containing protein
MNNCDKILASVLEHMDQGVLMADASMNVVYYNNRFLELLGLSKDFMDFNANLRDVVSEWADLRGHDQDWVAEHHKTLQLRKEHIFEMPGPGGRSIEIRHKPLNEGGLVRTFSDVTHRRLSEEKLKESEALYRLVVDNIPNGAVVLFDHDLRYVSVGGLGLKEDDLEGDKMVGKTIHELFPRDFTDIIEPLYRRTLQGERITADVPFAGKIFECRHIPLFDDSGVVRRGMVLTQDVTERRRDMEKLSDAEERWRSLIQNAPDIILTVDRNGEIITINHLPGQKFGEDLKANILDFVPDPMHRETVSKALDNVFETGGATFYEVVAKDFEGNERWYETRLSALRQKGEITSAILFTRDISARKRMEEELRNSRRNLEKRVRYRTEEYVAANQRLLKEIESRKKFAEELRRSEERYKAMFHANQAVKLLIDADTGSIQEANDAASAFYGYTREELLNLNIGDINILAPHSLRKALEAARSREKCRFLFRHRTKTGDIRDVEAYSSPILHQGRTLLFTIVQDVTQRIEAETALKESEHRYRTLFDNAGDAIVVHDMRGRILDVNKVACDRFGMRRSELTGMNLAAFYLPEFNKKASRIRKELRESGSIYFEGIQQLPDGGKLPIEVNAKVIPYRGRLAIMSVSRDLSERKKNEAMLKRLTMKLISVQEEERKRIGRELHDQLCQNLTAVKVLLEGQIRRVPDGHDEILQESLLKTIRVLQESVAEVRRIIMNLRPTVLDDMGLPAAVNWLCNEVEKLHPHMTVTAGISLRDEDCTEEIKTVLFRAVQETLNNAAKHSNADSVEIEISKSDREILVVVRDNGIGFPHDRVSGDGVGLHGMRERIEPLGGVIRIDSERGRGATVQVSIPEPQEGRAHCAFYSEDLSPPHTEGEIRN